MSANAERARELLRAYRVDGGTLRRVEAALDEAERRVWDEVFSIVDRPVFTEPLSLADREVVERAVNCSPPIVRAAFDAVVAVAQRAAAGSRGRAPETSERKPK